MSIDPRLGETHVTEAGQASDRVVDLARGAAAVTTAQEVGGDEPGLGWRLYAAADRCPEAIHQGSHNAGDARLRQAALRLLVVEHEVAGLITDDALEQIGEDGVISEGGEPLVADERRQLVDGAPGHVNRDEFRPGFRHHGDAYGLQACGPADIRSAARRDGFAGGRQKTLQHASVEGLLVDPAGQERRDFRIIDGTGRQQFAQIHDRVALDVLHVAQGTAGRGRQRIARDIVPTDIGHIDRARAREVAIEVEWFHCPAIRKDSTGGCGIRVDYFGCQDDVAATDRLLRPAFGMYRVEWPGDPGVEFHLSHGDWIRLLRRSGFDIEDLVELRPGADATTRYPFVTLEWARQWPCEEVWKARKRT